MGDAILFSVTEGVARITLNRPTRLNAFDQELARGWQEAAIAATSQTDIGAVLIDAAGPAFCAGGDVRAMATEMAEGDQLTELARVINIGIRALVESSLPVVAAAQGTTAGGGLGILLSSDYAVVGHDSRIGSLYAKIGLTPDLSVSALLARAVGERRALQLTLQDRLLSAEEARDWGLVAEIVDGADPAETAARVRARAEEIARSWVTGAADAYGQAKRLLRSQPERTFAEQLDEEARTIGRAFDTADAQERIAAFAKGSGSRG